MKAIGRTGLIAALLCFVAANVVQAASFTYSSQPKKIRAGVIIGSGGEPASRPDPYVFYVMDSRQDLKPAGWQFYNPIASSHVTEDIYKRWNTLEVAPPGSGWSRPYVYSIGQPITKNMGCYWEVPLSTDIEDLGQFDVLLLTRYGPLPFDRWQKEKLRKFVDGGGVLWIESRGGQTKLNDQFFLPGLNFAATSIGNPQPPALAADTAQLHSLINRPFLLLWKDIQTLGRGHFDSQGLYYSDNARTSITLNAFTTSEALWYFFPIVVRNGNYVVAAAQYGSGYVVVTAENIGQAISEPLGAAGVNDGTYRGLLPASESEDLRMAYNIVSWGSEHATTHKSPRRPGYSFAQIGAPLRPLWTYSTPAVAADKTDRSAAILDDTVFYVDNMNVLHAFDLSPTRDRDRDGNPDDGISDYGKGAEYDELWNHGIGSPCSSPTVAYVPQGSGVVVPMVFVQTAGGEVRGFDGRTGIEDPDSPYFKPDAYKLRTGTRPEVPAPAYVDGTLYAADAYGVLHAHIFFPTAGEWAHQDPLQMTVEEGTGYSPTVGYLHDPTSGATVQVVYVGQRQCGDPDSPGASNDGKVKAYPIKVFNEVLRKLSDTPTTLTYRTRSSNSRISDAGWHVYYQVGSTVTEIPQPTGVTITSPAMFVIADAAAVNAIKANNAIVLADYQLDYKNPIGFVNWRQIDIQHWTNSTPRNGVTGSPAASKKDIIYFGTDDGSLYAVKESGIPQTNEPPLSYKWRWCLQDPAIVGALGTALVPVGSPAVTNDLVYFAANAGNQGYILAFKADPEIVIRLPKPINRGTSPVVRQEDKINPEPNGKGYYQYTGVVTTDPNKVPANAVFTVNYDRGELRFVNFKKVGGGQLTISGSATVLYMPAPENPNDAVNQEEYHINPFDLQFLSENPNWNNLVWYMRVPMLIASSPMIMGDILYIGLKDGGVGMVDLSHGSIPENGPEEAFWTPDDNAWIEYPMGGASADPSDRRNWVLSTVCGSHGMLAVATGKGLEILYSPITLVTEPDQIVEINAARSKTWVCDSTISYSRTVASSNDPTVPGKPVYGAVGVSFNKPSVARQASIGGILVADTGNNRIVHVDRSGNLLRQVGGFEDPWNLLSPGLPMTLNKPTDVTLWMDTDPADSTHPIYHYLIADSGNYRVVQIDSRYDESNYVYRDVLAWSSTTLQKGKQYRFTTARPIRMLDPNAANPCQSPTLMSFVCAISKYDTSDPMPDITGGGLFRIDRIMESGVLTDKMKFITELPIDGFQDAAYCQPVPDSLLTCSGLPVSNESNTSTGSCLPPVHLFNPTFFNRQYVSNTEFHDVVIDAVGIHLVSFVLNAASNGIEMTNRTYSIDDHMTETGRPLIPVYAQYLPNGHILVTSRATFQAGGQAYYGEVFEIEPALQAVDPTRTGMLFVDNSSLNNVRQPMSAERQIF